MSPLSLITPTGGRPFALELCLRYMKAQTYPGPVQWIIVSDLGPPIFPEVPGWEIEVVYPEPKWAPGQNTLGRNLLAALPRVKGDRILFIEDDDWYSPDYLQSMASYFHNAPIVGESRARYYHLPSRRFRIFDNLARASLCQTGVWSSEISTLEKICEQHSDFIDVRLWEAVSSRYLRASRMCIGIKGLPGRPGIGIGHRPENDGSWHQDPTLEVLRLWVGNDINNYKEYLK